MVENDAADYSMIYVTTDFLVLYTIPETEV
jgi:hypothetical protein